MSLSKLSKVKILLDSDDPEKLHFVVLDNETRRYMSVKISSAKEHIERGNKRNYKSPLKNSYMLFRNDIIDTWNLAKETKKFRKYPESFKDVSLLWNNLPKNVIEIYEQTYTFYKKLIPKFEEFVLYAPQGENEENMDENIVETRKENTEKFVNNSETWIYRSEEFQHFDIPFATSVRDNEVVSDLDYNDYVPVQSSEPYTSEMQDNLHNLNREIEIETFFNSLLNPENDNDNMRGFSTLF